jgi:RHS repeat-associated protein
MVATQGILNINQKVLDLPNLIDNTNPVQTKIGIKYFELSNHASAPLSTGLGNVLKTISDRKIEHGSGSTVEYYTADIISATDYYPFGFAMDERNFSSSDYRFGFNGMEKDDEFTNTTSHYDFGARIYDSRLGRWLAVDPLAAKYPNQSPYTFTLNSPVIFKDPDGNDVVVAFTGGPTGGGKTLKPEDAGTTGKIVLNAKKEAMARGIEFDGTVIAPGWTSGSAVENAMSFIRDNYVEGEKLIIYGYSYGGDFAVELANKLNEEGIVVDLMITVDASDGPAQNSTVNTEIPDNVKVNRNIYQTNDSGPSSSSRSSGATSSSSSNSSGSSSSDSGTSNSPGSNGGPNTAADPSKTRVSNYNVTGAGVTHGNIDEKSLENNSKSINNFMSTSPTPQPSSTTSRAGAGTEGTSHPNP